MLTLPSGVGVRLYRPAGEPGPAPALLWIHGGGFVIGHAGQDDELCRRFARELGVTVVVGRLPAGARAPYPVAARGLLLRADLAGGAALGRSRPGRDRRRQRGRRPGRRPGAAGARSRRDRRWRHSCWSTRCSTTAPCGATDLDNPGHRLWNQSSNNSAGRPTSATPIPRSRCPRAGRTWQGLPPAWIGVGTLDLFHDEDLAYAERLKAAGRAVRGRVWSRARSTVSTASLRKPHVSQSFFDSRCALLSRAFARPAA